MTCDFPSAFRKRRWQIPALLLCLLTVALTACKEHREPASLEPVVFPIGGFSPSPARDRAAGFTLAGPSYSKEKERLAESEAAGLPMIYPVGRKIDFLGKKEPAPESLDIEAIKEDIRTQVREVADSDTIVAWYLRPEELRHWKPLEMDYLRAASEAIREADPKKRPFWMYEPNHRTADALAKTLPYQTIAGKGFYAGYANCGHERAWITWSLGQVHEALAAIGSPAPIWAILEMFQEPDEAVAIRSWARHDSYAALLGGAKGILVFSFAKRKGFDSWEAYYNAYSEVARELNGPLQLGAVFLRGKPVTPPSIRLAAGEPTTILTGTKSGPKEDTPVPSWQAQAYEYGSHAYVFLLNSSPNPITLEIAEHWEPLFSGQPPLTRGRLNLSPWEVTAFRRAL